MVKFVVNGLLGIGSLVIDTNYQAVT